MAGSRDYPDRPFLGVSTIVRRDGLILLVKRARPPLEGHWSFPGGLVELGETLKEAAAREVREEAAIEVEVGEQIETVEIIRRDEADRVDRHYVLAVFVAGWQAGEIAAGDDAAEARWFDPDDVAELTMTPDTARILSGLAED
jgi:8-oxo-dGTP diphosphatase